MMYMQPDTDSTQVHSYKELRVWQKAMEVVVAVYRLTDEFPRHEIYALTAQMRRAAVSIPSNIAEGYRRGTRKEYRNFLLISFGSGSELETQLELSVRIGYVTADAARDTVTMLDEVLRMLNVMVHKLATGPTPHPPLPTP